MVEELSKHRLKQIMPANPPLSTNLSANLTAGPILFFDSGIGGLTVLQETQKLLPNAPIVYAADYAGMPYGKKTERELAARVPALLGRLAERFRPELVTIACNTASTIALDYIRAALDIPVVGTVPAIKPASLITKTGVIGLLGTEATIRQPYVDRLSAEFASDKIVIRHGAPELVQAAEQKLRGETPNPAIFSKAIQGLVSQPGGAKMDVIVLACTHFPLVQEDLARACDQPIEFIDGAQGIARRIAYLTQEVDWPADSTPPIFVTSGRKRDLVPYQNLLKAYEFSEFQSL